MNPTLHYTLWLIRMEKMRSIIFYIFAITIKRFFKYVGYFKKKDLSYIQYIILNKN